MILTLIAILVLVILFLVWLIHEREEALRTIDGERRELLALVHAHEDRRAVIRYSGRTSGIIDKARK